MNLESFFHKYISNPCFNDCLGLSPSNSYKRPVRVKDALRLDLNTPIKLLEICTNKNLLINKVLLNIYEQDLLFLDSNYQKTREDFQEFYDTNFVAMGKVMLPNLEKAAFNFLREEIEIIGNWKKDKLIDYITEVISAHEKQSSELCSVIMNSVNPERALKMLLIQMAPDFLSEASAMARTLPGSFGVEQSELMKVFIDEYGYGVYQEKHSTLFEETMITANLNPGIHYYYNDYLPSSLMLVNYFHCICRNKAEWFKYIGMLYYTEASIPHFNKQVSQTFKSFMPQVNTKYFDEHFHIDKHHRRMVLEKIISTSIDKYGDSIIEDILFGFEAFRLLQNSADADLIQQIKFTDQLDQNNFISSYIEINKLKIFDEVKGEITSSHIHDEYELFEVTEGEVIFYTTILSPRVLRSNEKIIIPKGRLHATVPQTDKAKYQVQSIKLREIND